MRTLRVVSLHLCAVVLVALAVPLVAAPAAAGGGTCHSSRVTSERATEIEVANNCFEPTVTTVAVGDSVGWRMVDAVHTVTGANGSFGSWENIQAGELFEHTFDRAGVFPYFCALHPGMTGTVVVGGTRLATSPIASSSADQDGRDGTGRIPLGAAVAMAVAAAGLGAIAAWRLRRPGAPA